MKKELELLPLFEKFISETQRGKRLQKNGTRIRIGTINNYKVVVASLRKFSLDTDFDLRINNASRLSGRKLKSERIYWKRFYLKYTDYLYQKGNFDNYVGIHIKVIRCFFNYLNRDKGIFTGDFHKNFYVRNENIPIIVLTPGQLQYLTHNVEFESSLPDYLKRTKDIFVFGCTVGLRYSDLMASTKINLQSIGDSTYLCMRAQKTSTDTRVKLPDYILTILKKYKRIKTLLPIISDARLNKNLKELCERAGWVNELGKTRERRGMIRKISRGQKQYRFCDLVTTHTMRRTAITTLLSMGMPETMVRKISGHAANSKEFYRYVEYAQKFIDEETDKAFLKLSAFPAEKST